MGAALQALASVWPFARYYVSGAYKADEKRDNKDGTGGAMAAAFEKLVHGLYYLEPKSFAPTEMLRQAAAFQSRFRGLAQHDAQELLNFVVDGLHEDCNVAAGGGARPALRDQAAGESDAAYGRVSWEWYRSFSKSRVVDLFGGQFKSTLQCPDCEFRSVRFDAFNMVQLPLPSASRKDVSIVLRRLAPGLRAPDACRVPADDAPDAVKAAWDAVAAAPCPSPSCSTRSPPRRSCCGTNRRRSK
jgi:ubiquitin C-terminal hydrolase